MSWSLCFTPSCLDLVHNTLAEIWGESPLFTRNYSWWSLFAPCWLNLVIAPLDSISWDCTSYALSCLVLPLRGSPSWRWRVQNPLCHETLSCCDPSWWWNGPSWSLQTCPLSWLCTLWIALSMCNLYLIIDLSHCTHWPSTLEEAVPFQGEPQIRSKGTTPFPTHGFWSSGLCTMHLDISWLLPLLTCHHWL